jgi:hypothetical protein
MNHIRVASATLLVLAAAYAAEPAPAVEAARPAGPVREYTTQASRSIALSNADLKQLAKAALFVTEDGGKSWRKDQEIPVAENATAAPSFTFQAPKDGTFGLWTVATNRDGRAEPEPVAGAAAKLELVVDRAPPALALFEATLGGVADGKATLAVSWQVSDPNLVATPVSIEVSTDLGKTFTAETSGAASGTTALTVAAVAGSPEVQIRVVARDLAGNVLTSAAKPITLPVPAKAADPEAELAAAVAALPTPSELGVSGRGGSPIVTATGESPLASQAQPEAAKPAAAATAPAVGVAAGAVVAAGTSTSSAPAEAQAQPDVVAGQDVEARYARAAGAPSEQPRGRQADQPIADERPMNANGRATVVDPGVPFLTGGAASVALEAARRADTEGDVEGALGQYLRLHRSSVAKAALEDELALLRRVLDHATIIAIANQLPPELRTDGVRLHAARASLAQGDHAAAVAWAAKVRASADEAQESMLILGKGLKGLGRDAEAKRIFSQLAGGSDDIAAQARAEL